MNIGLITTTKNGSSKVLAETLHAFITESGNTSHIIYNIKALTRLFSAKEAGVNPMKWLIIKARYFYSDRKMFRYLRKMDAVVVCDFIPFAFYKNSYNIERFKKKVPGRPVLFYAVQYLENAPTLKERLQKEGHASLGRYDWHLSVSDITEVRSTPGKGWSRIGLYLKSTGLKPLEKEQFFAVVDFRQPGFEKFRQEQIEVLEELGVPYIALEKKYTLEEIREIYKKAAIYFIQSFEAYGMPIAENLAGGAYVFTAEDAWPMSWRLDEEVEIHGPGTLPPCFVVYKDAQGLREHITRIREEYDTVETPKKVFADFVKHYPSFYEGDAEGLKEMLDWIKASVDESSLK